MNYELRASLERVASRLRRRSLWASLAWCGLAWGLVALALLPTGPYPMGLVALLAGLALASSLGLAWRASAGDRDPRWVAGRIEAALPDLDAGLLTAIEADADGAPRNYLRQTVVDQAVEHGREHDWEGAVVPSGRLAGARLGGALGVGLALAAFGLLGHQARQLVGASGFGGPRGGATTTGLEVTPGNAEIERGSPLLVVARFGSRAPAEARLVVEGAEPRPMTRSLEDPAFAGRVETVESDLTYHVAFGEGRSPSYRVKVYEHPELTRIDAALAFPTYTGLEPKVAEDVRHVSAVEGTKVELTFRLSKEVASAALVDEAGTETPLAIPAKSDEPPALQAAMTLADSHKYKLKLVDRDGRANKLPADLAVNVSENKPPAVAFTVPAHDVSVSPVEELKLKAKAQDDFGVVRYGVSYALAGAEPREVILSSAEAPAKPVKKAEADHLIDFEALKAAPDELLSYFAWAEDVGPDGAIRRSEGDMYFAEVRHFEEIFRQGEQPSQQQQQQQQQQGGQQQQAEQLAELQKQIVNGTWRVIRRESDATKPSAEFAPDVKTLKEAQEQAIEQAATVGERLQDETSKKFLEVAVKAMSQNAERLAAAGAAGDPAALKPALASEQAAYQALLKLRAREHQVVRSRQQRGRQAGRSQSQRQLNQLELTEEENRFEERSQASAQETSEQEQQRREASQVASRLRELSRRQADLDARLKELQSALEAARDEEARKEIERQLKRLRDEQEQILRDADEVRERMEQEQNRERMAEARQQVEQGRENMRRASEALDKGDLAQALTEGARAGEKLDQVREDLRKQSANRFADDLTEMREQARKLDEAQDKLTERLEAEQGQSGRSLRDTPDRKDVEEGLARQRQDLEKLVDRMKATVEEAEEPEPLLAKSLYDAARNADRQDIPRAIQEAERLTQLGVPEEAAKSSRRAGEGLDQLREGLERAARSVLGDEIAALKRAQNEVEDLADQVDREITQADPNLAGRPPGEDEGQPRQGRRGQQQGQEGQQEGQGQQQDQAQEGQQQGKGQEQQDQQGQQGRRGQQQSQGQQQGQQPGQRGQQGQEGQQPGQGQQQGQGGQGQGEQQGQRQGQGQGGQQRQGEQQGQGRQQGQGGQQGQGQQQWQGGRQQQGGQQQGGRGRSNGDRLMDAAAGGPGGNPNGPIRGEGYRQWADRMRDVEEILDDPELRAEAARIRDRVRGVREEYKRHAKEPDWTQLKQMVADPIRELQERIAEEVRRREEPDAPVPIDRDPVPPRFAEGVRRYYERLGSGR